MRCERQWYYAYELGLIDEVEASKTMSEGTLGHVGLAAAYEYMREAQEQRYPFNVIHAKFLAQGAMVEALKKGTVNYRGKEQKLTINADNDPEAIIRMGDVVEHYLDTHSFTDYARYRILAVEQPFQTTYYLPFGIEVEVSGILDVLAQDMTYENKRVATVIDHKFVGDVKGSVEFLPLDLQMIAYDDIVHTNLVIEGEFADIELIYDAHKREVPPGYGHRELRLNKNGSVAKNNASQDPEDYFKRSPIRSHSPRERKGIRDNFLIPLLRSYTRHKEKLVDYYMRRPIKTGGEACSNCFAKARCSHDLLGRHMPSFEVKPKITVT